MDNTIEGLPFEVSGLGFMIPTKMQKDCSTLIQFQRVAAPKSAPLHAGRTFGTLNALPRFDSAYRKDLVLFRRSVLL